MIGTSARALALVWIVAVGLAGLARADQGATASTGGTPASQRSDLVRFAGPWTTPFHADKAHPFHLVNTEGRHLFILNKTAWAYFACKDPEGVLARARRQGITVLRVALEGTPYLSVLGWDMWPWAGTRDVPDFSRFNEKYWDEVDRRIRLAGEAGLGLDVVLYFTLHPSAAESDAQQLYWDRALSRLGRYANVVTWEIANEYLDNEAFQDAAGQYVADNDPYGRPVITSDGTTDAAAWPTKTWVGMAVNHSCTSSTPRHGLRRWYLAVARNTRSYGKPAWCNESGRENRHKNDDGVHRRKQGWLWNAAGASWTHHSWDGCEGIDDGDYRAPGEEFLEPMAKFFQALPFWDLAPSETTLVVDHPAVVSTALTSPDRSTSVAYACTETSGAAVSGAEIAVRLPAGRYEARFVRPADNATMGTRDLRSTRGLAETVSLPLPDFTDDLAVVITMQKRAPRTAMPDSK